MIKDVDSEETRELTKLIIGALTYLVKGNSSAGDEEKLREFSRNVKPLSFSDKTFMSDYYCSVATEFELGRVV